MAERQTIWARYPAEFARAESELFANLGSHVVDLLIDESAPDIRQSAGMLFLNWTALTLLVETPIELLLAPHIATMTDGYNHISVRREETQTQPFQTVCIPQYQTGICRVDFMFISQLDACRRYVVVECDGHDFHERTKEQAKRDRSRDRAFQEKDVKILRFTGSEIFRNSAACVEQITSVLARECAALIQEAEKS